MILVCAATRTEAAACHRGIADAGAAGFEVLTTGVGPARARSALGRWLAGRPGAGQRPGLVVSSGFAGTLSPAVAPLQWVTASSVHRLEAGGAVAVAFPPGLLQVADGAVACHVVSCDDVVTGAVAHGFPQPAAVDMESAALAEVAAAAGIPFLVLRLVTDTPARPLAELGRRLAATLGAHGAARRAAHGVRAALEAARSPGETIAFVRESLGWRDRLRHGWRERARGGLRSSATA